MLAFVPYLLAAGAATCVDVALVQAILSFDYLRYDEFFAFAICVGAIAGMSVNFWLSRRFVFALDERSARQQFLTFLVISCSTLALRLLFAYLFLALFLLPALSWIGALPIDAPAERISHLGAVGIVTIYSFLAHKHVSFSGGLGRWFGNRTMVS